ncbi:hypothetical protein CMI47_21690 [Candidatus Pacearchaeota archaeon]|nr:hypothetical protein [Candidatus Pacearchaeota archaeon]|tara:strand:+ start:2185 stop:2586 length:402 start_codon:yes stop_codon:yes gene_type:complete
MKKADFKQLIKPLVKECMQEVLLEEGLLANVVSEVARGLQGNLVVESAAPVPEEAQIKRQTQQTRKDLQQHRKKLMEAVGQEAYGGVNLFEGTEPMHQSEPKQGHADLGSPNDAGVDISSLVGNASNIWQAMK